jgi:hypothetical protein
MVAPLHDFLDSVGALKSNETKAPAPVGRVVKHDRALDNLAVSTKVLLEICVLDGGRQPTDKDLVDPLCERFSFQCRRSPSSVRIPHLAFACRTGTGKFPETLGRSRHLSIDLWALRVFL